jgi:hypothetical protein
MVGAIALAALLIHVPALIFSSANTHSAINNFIWTTQFAEAFARGDFYPRWFPESFEGLGSPTFYFYPPLAFWVSGFWAALGFDAPSAVVIAAAFFSAASGIAMYFWLAPRTRHALWWALAYMIAPYHLYDFYVRGALAEYAAFIWPPLILLAIDGLPDRRRVGLLAISYAGMVITHLPGALLATVFLVAPYALYQCYLSREKLFPCLVGGILGLGLASFYLLPALTLQEHISTEVLWSGFYQPSFWFPWNRFEVGHLLGRTALAVALLICGAAARNFWGFVTCIIAAASIGLIPFIWDVEILSRVQFPWRLLALAEFTAITAVAVGVRFKGVLKGGLLVGILPCVVFASAAVETWNAPVDFAPIERNRPDAPEYLPRGLGDVGVSELQRIPDLTAFAHLPRGTRFEIAAPGRVTVGHAEFPIWQVVRNGQVIPHSGPLITFDAPASGTYTIERRTLPVEAWGWALSAVAAALLLALQFTRVGFAAPRRRTAEADGREGAAAHD